MTAQESLGSAGFIPGGSEQIGSRGFIQTGYQMEFRVSGSQLYLVSLPKRSDFIGGVNQSRYTSEEYLLEAE